MIKFIQNTIILFLIIGAIVFIVSLSISGENFHSHVIAYCHSLGFDSYGFEDNTRYILGVHYYCYNSDSFHHDTGLYDRYYLSKVEEEYLR